MESLVLMRTEIKETKDALAHLSLSARSNPFRDSGTSATVEASHVARATIAPSVALDPLPGDPRDPLPEAARRSRGTGLRRRSVNTFKVVLRTVQSEQHHQVSGGTTESSGLSRIAAPKLPDSLPQNKPAEKGDTMSVKLQRRQTLNQSEWLRRREQESEEEIQEKHDEGDAASYLAHSTQSGHRSLHRLEHKLEQEVEAYGSASSVAPSAHAEAPRVEHRTRSELGLDF